MLSPDGRISADFSLHAGSPRYSLRFNNSTILQHSRLGIVRDDEDFSNNLTLLSQSGPQPIEDNYQILTAKRRINHYHANRYVFHMQTAASKKLDIIFQLSSDGLAFRYHFPESDSTLHNITGELTSFQLPPHARAFLQPMQVAKTGFESSNPAYEELYEKNIPVGTPSTLGVGWVFPSLFHVDDAWVLISESALSRNHCASRLAHESPDGNYSIAFPDPRETIDNAPVNPHFSLPWHSPWRVIAVGSLKTIAESTLGIDLADNAVLPSTADWIKPGKASWSWPLMGDANTTYDVQKRFIDYAAQMKWEYCLIDGFWDKQIGYEKIAELVRYAATKNVGILLWYNSAGDWNTTPQTPRNKMLTRDSRLAEFAKLKSLGVKGAKIDFFPGDGQSAVNYYLDILDDAAQHQLLVNFHGSTLPRGWHRTYPHLMTMESIRGFEFITFDQRNADEQPTHCAMLPFTRNVFDPMDFTPLCFDAINDKVTRRTTPAFELALSILFTSGIQHYAEIPTGMAKMPDYVRDFLRHVPSIWDDTKFLDGFPGQFVVLARKAHTRWYLAAINGQPIEKNLTLDLSSFSPLTNAQLITDDPATNLFQITTPDLRKQQIAITLKPHGGFVMTADQPCRAK